jgi:integrase
MVLECRPRITNYRSRFPEDHVTHRHTAASIAKSSGANPKAVQRLLGHASAAMNLDTCADLFEDDLDVVSERMDKVRTKAIVGEMWGNRVNDAEKPL